MPDLPTIGETVPGYQVTSWYGVLVPAGTPAAIIARLHKEIATAMKQPDMIDRMAVLGIEAEGNSPQEFAVQIREELVKWAKVVKLARVPLQ